MDANSNPRHKDNDLFPINSKHPERKMNLANIKLLSRLVLFMNLQH